MDAKATRVHRRIAATMAAAATLGNQRDYDLVRQPPPQPRRWAQEERAAGHRMVKVAKGSTWKCALCCGTVQVHKEADMRQWLEKFPCTGKCDRHLQRVTDEQGRRRAGGKQPDDARPGELAERIHDSHHLGYKQGFYWCWRCAKVATSKVQKLGERCAGPVADRSAQTMLRRLRQGRLPYAAWTMWPNEKRQGTVLTLSEPKPKVIAKTKRSQQQKRRRHQTKKQER